MWLFDGFKIIILEISFLEMLWMEILLSLIYLEVVKISTNIFKF